VSAPTEKPAGDRRPPSSAARRAVYRFAAGSLLVLLVVGLASFVVARDLAKDTALKEARVRGAAFARGVGAPLVNSGVRTGDPVQMSKLNEVLRNRLVDGSIVHIKLWDRAGRVLWSDEHGLPGHVFRLEPAVAALFGTDNVIAESSSRNNPENKLEEGEAPLVEVYTGVRDADGVPLVFESYWSTDRVDADRREILTRLAPLSLGSLILLELAMLPLAISLARRVDREKAQQSRMLQYAVSGADLERRRIVRNLHDGLIQDLAALGYAIPLVSSKLPPTEEVEPARRALDDLGSAVERDVASLRTLITDVYPTNLRQGGLQDAVDVLVRSAGSTGLVVTTDIDGEVEESLMVTQLAFRVIREGLRNVVEHAEAKTASIIVARDGSDVVVTVSDDGRGAHPENAGSGHLGLKLLSDMTREVGGHMEVWSRNGHGTTLQARFPVHLEGA
jgi:signal transduction histidine kinase